MLDYQEYIQSEKWKFKRDLVLLFWQHRCSMCGRSVNLHVHHRTYKRLGNEQLNDLVVLCDRCHEIHHETLNRTGHMEHIGDVMRRVKYKVMEANGNGAQHGFC